MTADVLLRWVEFGSYMVLVSYLALGVAYRKRIADRWHQLAAQKRHHAATILIDTGDGKPVPLDQASKSDVAAAITALEKYRNA
jgi:hypothetical protein